MTGYERMQRALARSVLSRPRGLFERLVFPMMRAAFEEGYKAGYANGHIDGQHSAERAQS